MERGEEGEGESLSLAGISALLAAAVLAGPAHCAPVNGLGRHAPGRELSGAAAGPVHCCGSGARVQWPWPSEPVWLPA
jgi:hypothetical protein